MFHIRSFTITSRLHQDRNSLTFFPSQASVVTLQAHPHSAPSQLSAHPLPQPVEVFSAAAQLPRAAEALEASAATTIPQTPLQHLEAVRLQAQTCSATTRPNLVSEVHRETASLATTTTLRLLEVLAATTTLLLEALAATTTREALVVDHQLVLKTTRAQQTLHSLLTLRKTRRRAPTVTTRASPSSSPTRTTRLKS